MDLVLRNGTLIDGASANVYKADVGVVDDLVTRVGDLAGQPARREIDCLGLVVAPGFIDPHGRSGLALLAEPGQRSKLAQGITTEVVGCLGDAPFPVAGANAPAVGREAERLGVQVGWDDAAGYIRRVREADPALNVAVLAGREALRAALFGLERRSLGRHERSALAERLERELAAGLFGLSVGLGGTPADEGELAELAARLDPARHHLSVRLRGEGPRLVESLEECLRVAERGGTPLHLCHLEVRTPGDAAMRDALVGRIEAARARGLDVTADWHPYAASSVALSEFLPGWLLAGGPEATLRRLRDPLVRGRARQAVRAALPDAASFSRVRVARVSHPADNDAVGQELDALHRRSGSGRDPAETLLSLLERNGLDVQAHLFTLDERIQDSLWELPWVMASTGDAVRPLEPRPGEGIPHPRAFGAFPRILKRAHDEGGLRALGECVRKMTSLAAARLRLPDRGRIAAGYKADLVVLSPTRLKDIAGYDKPREPPAGIRMVFVNGRLAYREGEGYLARAGRVLKPGVR